jgi:hypothetical protein
VRTNAAIPMRARSVLHHTFGTDRYSLRDSAWITQGTLVAAGYGSKQLGDRAPPSFLRQPGLSQAIGSDRRIQAPIAQPDQGMRSSRYVHSQVAYGNSVSQFGPKIDNA